MIPFQISFIVKAGGHGSKYVQSGFKEMVTIDRDRLGLL
jgi:hypothetical protein